ncbi:MAG TPA: hypothetical protein VLE47_04710 [Candidatus Saccharimonadales bacterium]|nr:hypothetical protein [Candidatus Saccharimonadales bacterium]
MSLPKDSSVFFDKNKLSRKNLLGESAIVLSVLVLIGLILGAGLILRNHSSNSQNKKQATAAAKPNKPTDYQLGNMVVGLVTSIDKNNKTIMIQTSEDPPKIHKILIGSKTMISLAPSPYASASAKVNYSRKFENLRVGNVLQIITKEDPKITNDLNALTVVIVI